jgi:hypothetical protein
MRLLFKQQDQVKDVIETSSIPQRLFTIEDESKSTIVRYTGGPVDRFSFRFNSSETGFRLWHTPGLKIESEEVRTADWPKALARFVAWLEHLDSELKYLNRDRDASGEPRPDWVEAAMPSEYHAAVSEAALLQNRVKALEKMSRLLWDTGNSLTDAVQEAFNAAAWPAESTEVGATYDLTVTVPKGSTRLLVEVTGIDGPIAKKSNKISQALQAYQTIATATDRIVVAVNAFRTESPASRLGRDIATRDAVALFKPMGVVVIPTVSLFDIWRTAIHGDVPAAQARLQKIVDAPAGVLVDI